MAEVDILEKVEIVEQTVVVVVVEVMGLMQLEVVLLEAVEIMEEEELAVVVDIFLEVEMELEAGAAMGMALDVIILLDMVEGDLLIVDTKMEEMVFVFYNTM